MTRVLSYGVCEMMVSELAANAGKATLLRNSSNELAEEDMSDLPSGVQAVLHNRRISRGFSLPSVRHPPLFTRRSTFFGGRPSSRKTSTTSCRERRDFFRKYGPLGNSFAEDSSPNNEKACNHTSSRPKTIRVLDPTGRTAHQWLFVVSLAVSYFTWTVIFRAAFPSVQDWSMWTIFDGVFYCVYLADLLAQSRTSYLQDGLLEEDLHKIFSCYVATWQFKLDVLASLPLDWLWMMISTRPIALLFIRLLKFYRLRQFADRSENRTHFSHACRVLFMLHDLLMLIHWNACVYFLLSRWVGLGSDGWVYPAWNTTHNTKWGALSHKYIYSFYWSTMTLTTIGEVPSPETTLEYLFVTFDYFLGILMFATLVGNIGNIINNMQRNRVKFQNKMSQIKNYMQETNVPAQLQERVVKWFEYLWAYNTHVDEKQVLDSLPDKLKAEIGMHVHFETLKKADFFAECEHGLLWELVLRLRTQVYSPGEYVCRKGDVGREMYMVSSGKLEVLAEEDGWILRTLVHGESFGEISVLDLGRNNRRRTAFVRSVGYSVLLCLNEADLSEVLQDYPKTKERMIEKGWQWLGVDTTAQPEAEQAMPPLPPFAPSPLRRQVSEISSESSDVDPLDEPVAFIIPSMTDQIAATNHRLLELEKLVHQVLTELQKPERVHYADTS